MFDAKLVEMLRCPLDGNRLEIAGNTVLQQLNDAIGRGELRDRMDQKITLPLDAALINREANRGFPVRGGIPSLVADEAFELPS